MTPEQQKEFLCGYTVCAVWSSTGDDGEPLDSAHDESDLAQETLQAMKNSCAKFISENENDLAEYVERRAIPRGADCSGADWAGHDFWLTRNGHGTGFWDRGLGKLGDRLSEASKAFGESHLYAGDDGKLYLFEG